MFNTENFAKKFVTWEMSSVPKTNFKSGLSMMLEALLVNELV